MTTAAEATMGAVRARLSALVHNRDFVFRDTRKSRAEEYLKRLTAFRGISEQEVSRIEEQHGGSFSKVFREYLLTMAENPGRLFSRCALAPGAYPEDTLRTWARNLCEEDGNPLPLKRRDFVFLFREGYEFYYVSLVGGEDSPVYIYEECREGASVLTATFSELVEKELELMEANNVSSRKMGGYFLILFEGGMCCTYPALSDGPPHPLDIGDTFFE